MTNTRFLQRVLAVVVTVSALAVYANAVKSLVVAPPDGYDRAPVIAVFSSDGDTYDSVDKTRSSRFDIDVTALCRVGIKRKRQPYHGELSVPGFVRTGVMTPTDRQIPDSRTASAEFRYADGAGQIHSAPQLCQDEVQRRLGNNPGKSKYEIMAKGFSLQTPAVFKTVYTLTCAATGLGGADIQSHSVMLNVTILCKPSDLAAAYVPVGEVLVSKVELTPLVSAVKLSATPDRFVSTCPATVQFAGEISVSRPGMVTYRYVNNKGQRSATLQLDFSKADTLATRSLSQVVAKDYGKVTLPVAPATPNMDNTALPVMPAITAAPGEASGEVSDDGSGALSGAASPLPVMPAITAAPGEASGEVSDDVSGAASPQIATVVATELDNETDGELDDRRRDTATVGPEEAWDISGWQRIDILTPEVAASAPAGFAVRCNPAAGTK